MDSCTGSKQMCPRPFWHSAVFRIVMAVGLAILFTLVAAVAQRAPLVVDRVQAPEAANRDRATTADNASAELPFGMPPPSATATEGNVTDMTF